VAVAERLYKAFGAKVRERRQTMEMTQLQLSRQIGLTRGSVANIEAGRQSVLLHQFFDITAALQIEPEQLLPANSMPASVKETAAMPDAVIQAIESIRKSAGTRSPDRR
jgi:transcriptional regulator with XRE-family HTH domain